MKQSSRTVLLSTTILAVAAAGIAVHVLWYPSKLSAYLTLLVVLVLTLLMKLAAKWRMFRLSSAFPAPIPQISSRWKWRTLGKALLCFVGAFSWGGLLGLGIKLHIIDAVSIPVGWLLLSPAIALIASAMFFLARAVFSRNIKPD